MNIGDDGSYRDDYNASPTGDVHASHPININQDGSYQKGFFLTCAQARKVAAQLLAAVAAMEKLHDAYDAGYNKLTAEERKALGFPKRGGK